MELQMEDREVKTTVRINPVKMEGDILSNMVEQISSCKMLLQVMAFVMNLLKGWRNYQPMEMNQMFWLSKICNQQKS